MGFTREIHGGLSARENYVITLIRHSNVYFQTVNKVLDFQFDKSENNQILLNKNVIMVKNKKDKGTERPLTKVTKQILTLDQKKSRKVR